MSTMSTLLSSSSSTPTLSSPKPHHHKPHLLISFSKFCTTKRPNLALRVSADNGTGVVTSTVEEDKVVVVESSTPSEEKVKASNEETSVAVEAAVSDVKKFENPKWVGGTWDLAQFSKNGSTDWDAVIDAEAKRRKWLETYPESTSNNEPIVFDTSIIPWWAWIKRFHLPEAEILNGRAAMIGFFMAYFVDSLTGLGLVDQMNNFILKTLMFVAVLGVLLIRKNEDVENLKKLLEETTFYDKQWQATWQDDTTSKKD